MIQKIHKKISKINLLILDEFLLTQISETERNDLFEIIELRTVKNSTIYCSQCPPEGWLENLRNGPLADAILDRVRNSSYTILLKGRSLREDYSKIKQSFNRKYNRNEWLNSVEQVAPLHRFNGSDSMDQVTLPLLNIHYFIV